jgi:tetratricopeptide (TPR) repeat protein
MAEPMVTTALVLLLGAPPAADVPPLGDLLASAQRLFAASDRAGARRELTRAATLYPASPVVQNFLGIVDAEDGQPAAAEARFRQAVRLDARYTDAYLNLGRLYQETAARDREAAKKALAVYEAVLGYEPAHAEANFQAATLLRAAGELSRALEGLEKMPAEAQARTNARRLRADICEAQGALDRARAVLDEEASARPTVEVLLELARLASRQQDYQGALGYLAHARGLDPQNARVHFLFGLACVKLDLGVEAFNSLREAARLAPDDPDINYALGAVALHRRDAGEAIPFFRKYAERRPDEPRVWLALGVAYFRSGDFASARRELARAAVPGPTLAAAHYFLARIAREENDLPEALRLARLAVEEYPEYADAHAELGLVYFRLRQGEEAEKSLRRALGIEPDNYLANLHLQMLYERNRDPRAPGQKQRVEELGRQRDQKADEFRRIIEVQPN